MANTTLIDRALIRLSGDDVRGFLQGLVTNDTSGDLPVWAALLSAQGKALFDFLIWGDGDDILIDCERDAAGDLAKRRRSIACAAPSRSRASLTCVSIGRWAATSGSSIPRLPELGQRWLAPAAGEAGADDAWLAHRLALGVTEGRAELGDGTTLWLECNAAELNGVSFTKGCYVGQENTARMNWRQKVNRRLVVVPIAAADEKRQVIAYPALGWSVEHRRVESIDAAAAPLWMRGALVPASA